MDQVLAFEADRDISQNVDTIDRPQEIVTLANEAVHLSAGG